MLDLNAKGIKNTAALLGGWNGWREANLPFDTTPPPPTPPSKPEPLKKH